MSLHFRASWVLFIIYNVFDFMKKMFLGLLLCLLCSGVFGQTDFTWKITESGSGTLLLTITGTLDEGWHISSHSLKVEQADCVILLGDLEESVSEQADAAGRTVVCYRQRFVPQKQTYSLKGYLQYMACTDMMCLAPQTVEFEHHGTAPAAEKKENAMGNATGNTDGAEVPSVASADVQGTDSAVLTAASSPSFLASAAWTPVIEELKAMAGSAPDGTAAEETGAPRGMLALFLLAFGGGLLAILTPCVWPMIPLTVSFFLRQAERQGAKGGGIKGALLYGGSIVVIFVALGVMLTVLFGANALNQLSTNAVFNVVCFLVLMFFGVSLLGLFELRLPSSWANALDSRSSATTGVVSIFLMALTMVVVSFSCTAPVMGLLLVEIASASSAGMDGAAMLTPVVGMTGFALALALPFTLFALFPGLMQRVPRSGNWMTSVKVTLGFIEMAFALKFLSVADMAYGWCVLPRTTFLIVWILLAAACGAYHAVDWQQHRLNPLRRQKVTVLCIAIVAYLVPGLKGAPCTLVSAFLPPVESGAATVFRDYDEALLESRRTGRPVFIDFTGYGCVNCRKMEAAVFADAEVRRELVEKFVMLQLYVDDRTPLPRHLQAEGRTLRTVGDKWALLESHKFGSVAQPFYVIVSADGKPLTRSYAYDESKERFLRWIRSVKE